MAVTTLVWNGQRFPVREPEISKDIGGKPSYSLRFDANAEQGAFSTATHVDHGNELIPVSGRLAVLGVGVLAMSSEVFENLLEPRPPGDNDADSYDAFTMQCLKIVEIAMEEWILIIPLHLVGYARVGAVVAHGKDIDLMVPNSVHRFAINEFFDGDVVLAPAAPRETGVVSSSVPRAGTAALLNILGVIYEELIEVARNVCELPGEGVFEDEIGISSHTIAVSGWQFHPGFPNRPRELGLRRAHTILPSGATASSQTLNLNSTTSPSAMT